MGAFSVWHLLILLVVLAIVVVIVKSRSSARAGYQPPTTIAPGWYPDHANPAVVRWFDGYQWTNHTQPRQ
ncbi:DUF2510 domain-containing protein [Nocardia sp. NPDC051463]|uniref:DUF2510 domain-containing protein n=1 Tax=Nocardia sp. NPDC051463 TaxID=3154845 RepID=UPI00344F0CCE